MAMQEYGYGDDDDNGDDDVDDDDSDVDDGDKMVMMVKGGYNDGYNDSNINSDDCN